MTFDDAFDRLPESERQEVLHLLRKALMCRGGGGVMNDLMRQGILEDIAAVFLRNGCEIGEYT